MRYTDGMIEQKPQKTTLTAKQAAYVKGVAEGKKKVDAVRDAYNITNPNSDVPKQMAKMLDKNPTIMAFLAEHQREMEEAVIDVVRDAKRKAIDGDNSAGAMYARVAVDGSNSILDRLHGKASQNINMNVQAVNLNVDLSQ